MELLTGLRESRGLSILFVAHNIGLVRSLAQDVVVMQAGPDRGERTGGRRAVGAEGRPRRCA